MGTVPILGTDLCTDFTHFIQRIRVRMRTNAKISIVQESVSKAECESGNGNKT